jgi:hypothetical protein
MLPVREVENYVAYYHTEDRSVKAYVLGTLVWSSNAQLIFLPCGTVGSNARQQATRVYDGVTFRIENSLREATCVDHHVATSCV